MSDIESLIASVDRLRSSHVRSSIATPRDKTEFEFGRVCGFDEAIGAVLELINNLLEESTDDEDKHHSNNFGRPLIG